MRQTDFARHLTDFLGKYLTEECGYSHNTVKTYSFTFSLLLEYIRTSTGVKPEKVTLSLISKKTVLGFLRWLEEERGSSAATRNARLAAVHSFVNYLQYRNVGGIAVWQDIMSIKRKKTSGDAMEYLTIEGLRLVLQQPDLKTRHGRRDLALLGLLYDSGCRVQELISLTPSDLNEGNPHTIRLCGKGRKVRTVPLSPMQVKNLKAYMCENGLDERHRQNHPLFPNPQGNPMSRMAVLNIVKKYTSMARVKAPELIPDNIGCHSMRHSKAMHMLEAEVNLVYIRDFLGHSSTTTTEVYARASDKLKEKALAKLDPSIVQEGRTSWQKNKELLSFLKDLQTKY